MSNDEGSQARWEIGRVLDTLGATRRGPQRPLEHLIAMRHAHEALSRATFLMVDAARSEGATWAQIGEAIGISRQAARQAQLRRQRLDQAREEAKQWRMPLPVHRPRFWWLPRRPRPGRRAA